MRVLADVVDLELIEREIRMVGLQRVYFDLQRPRDHGEVGSPIEQREQAQARFVGNNQSAFSPDDASR